jgi:arsenical pump membrane protein
VRLAAAVAVLLGVLAFAVARPWRLPEAVAAVPGAALLVATGVLGPRAAGDELRALAPTVAFLAAVLVLAHVAAAEGVFRYAGSVLAAGSRGRPVRLLGLVFAVAAAVTAVLSLDATVVLLTPVVFATASGLRLPARPHVFACTHLANSASLLLPVSNLTNLLAFGASGLSFGWFAALMAAPWLAVLAVEYGAFRWFFAADLRGRAGRPAAAPERAPGYALGVVGLTLVGFLAGSWLAVDPAWVAGAGALVLAAPRLARRRLMVRRVVAEASPAFLVFVLALAVVVRAVSDNGLGRLLGRVLPDAPTLAGLLLAAAVAAVLANLVNNLPAVLMLVPAAAAGGPGLLLAVLVGVNVGPNLTYVGSLATLLWRRVLHAHDAEPGLGEFTRLGLVTVPAALLAGVLALWAALALLGT